MSVIIKGAVFDAETKEASKYRYLLWRIWDQSKPCQLWIMLNPSTADEVDNDPTVERCERRARAAGFGGVKVCNIFALRSTDPQVLYQKVEDFDPIGPANDWVILDEARKAGEIICGWGVHGSLLGRGAQVTKLLRDAGLSLKALRVTKDGHPGHPLYVGYDVEPTEFV